MDNPYGIYQRSFSLILEEISKFPQIEQILLFGSRAMGNYKKGSDIDLALKGAEVTCSILTQITGRLNEEIDIPYKCDVVHWDTLQSAPLRKHILEEGIVIYKRDVHST